MEAAWLERISRPATGRFERAAPSSRRSPPRWRQQRWPCPHPPLPRCEGTRFTRAPATTPTTFQSTRGRAANRIPTSARRRARLRRARGADRSSSPSGRMRRCWGIGRFTSVWIPGVERAAMPICGSLTRVSAQPVVACGSLQMGHGGRANSFFPCSVIEPRVGCPSGGCIRASGFAGSSSPRLARRGRSRGWMSMRPMIVAGTCRDGDGKVSVSCGLFPRRSVRPSGPWFGSAHVANPGLPLSRAPLLLAAGEVDAAGLS